jgi:hypothetical protein
MKKFIQNNKTFIRQFKSFLLCFLLTLVWSCSSSFTYTENGVEILDPDSTQAGLQDGSEGQDQQTDTPKGGLDQNPPPHRTIWSRAEIELQGLVSGGTYDGTTVMEVLPERQSLALILPLPPIFLAPLQTLHVPMLPGLSIEYFKKISSHLSIEKETTHIALIVPFKYLVNGGHLASLSPHTRLPNGSPIPFLPSGESRGFVVQLPQKSSYKVHFYFVANAMAVFVETPDWRLPEELSLIPTIGFPVRNKNQTQINGYFGIVPNKNQFSSGLFLSTRIPKDLAFQIDQILKY